MYSQPLGPPVSSVNLYFQCQDLPDTDLLSKSDPQVYLLTKSGRTNNNWVVVGKTEQVKNNLSPKFNQPIKMDYWFEELQYLRIVVVDVDNEKESLYQQDFLGMVETTLGNLVSGTKVREFSKPLEPNPPADMIMTKHKKRSKFSGTVKVACEEVSGSNMSAFFKMNGVGLDKKDLFSSDPFLRIQKEISGVWQTVHTTEVVKSNLNPSFNHFSINLSSLTGNVPNKYFRVECWDHDNDGSHDLIGSCDLTVEQLRSGMRVALINEKKREKKGSKYTNSGFLEFERFELVKEVSFLEFVQNGMEISLCVAVDYTQSNGDPNHDQSLHRRGRHPQDLNQYQRAILNVGSVLEPYDTDKLFPVWGFGGQLPNGVISHCWNLNGQTDPSVRGVHGIMETYNNSFNFVKLAYPTIFSDVIRETAKHAKAEYQFAIQNGRLRKYHILLILTDGVISDMEETIDTIVNSSPLPMSIIIVGVGNADFSAMDILDGDKRRLRSGNKEAERDIVQFVPFNKYTTDPPGLAQATLAELPKQVVEFAKKNHIRPV